MCSHPEHEVTERPDGVIAETHVLTDADMEQILSAVDRLSERMWRSLYGYPQEVS